MERHHLERLSRTTLFDLEKQHSTPGTTIRGWTYCFFRAWGFSFTLNTMKLPQPVTAQDAAEAIQRILDRRRRINDPHLDAFIAAGHDLGEIKGAVLRYRRGIPDWVAEADMLDAQVLNTRQYWNWAEDDLAILVHGERLGVNRKSLGRTLNLGSGQAIPDRIRARRRQLAHVYGQPDPDSMEQHAEDTDRATAKQRWIDSHTNELDQARKDLLAYIDFADDDAYESLRDVEDEPWTPATLTLLTYATFELRQSASVASLPERHELWAILEKWDDLSQQYRRIDG